MVKKLTAMQTKDNIIKTLQDENDELFLRCSQLHEALDSREVDLINFKHQIIGYKAVISYLESKIK